MMMMRTIMMMMLMIIMLMILMMTMMMMKVWLLGGSDRRVHIYSEDTAKHMYMEVDPGVVVPELAR